MSKRDQFEVIKPCFLCMWDSRDRTQHYMNKDWPLREELVPRKERNVINNPLVDRDRILFPSQHIKLSLINQFTKALDKDGDYFTYLCQAFPGLTMEKLKTGIFDGPQIRKLVTLCGHCVGCMCVRQSDDLFVYFGVKPKQRDSARGLPRD